MDGLDEASYVEIPPNSLSNLNDRSELVSYLRITRYAGHANRLYWAQISETSDNFQV